MGLLLRLDQHASEPVNLLSSQPGSQPAGIPIFFAVVYYASLSVVYSAPTLQRSGVHAVSKRMELPETGSVELSETGS